MNWALEPGAQHRGYPGQSRGEKALHVRRTTAVKPPAALRQRPRVAAPVLTVDRYDVSVSGKHDATCHLGTDGEQQVRLAPFCARYAHRRHTKCVEPRFDRLDEREVGIA